MEQRPPLEPIQEESEQEEENQTVEQEDFQSRAVLETEEMMTEDESDEEDGAFISRKISRSLSQERFPQMQSTINHWKEMTHFTALDSDPYTLDLSDDAASPRAPRLEQKWCRGGKLRGKVGGFAQFLLKIKLTTHAEQRRCNCRFKSPKIRHYKPLQPPVKKKTKKERRKKKSVVVSVHSWPSFLFLFSNIVIFHQYDQFLNRSYFLGGWRTWWSTWKRQQHINWWLSNTVTLAHHPQRITRWTRWAHQTMTLLVNTECRTNLSWLTYMY